MTDLRAESDLSRRKLAILLTGMTCCALFLRLLHLYFEPVLSRDSIFYIEVCRVWASGCFADVYQVFPEVWIPPLFLYLLKTMIKCGANPEIAGFVFNLILGIALVPLAYFFARGLQFSRRCSLWAGALAMMHPRLIELSIQVQRENLYLVLLFLAAIFLIYGSLRKQVWLIVWSAAFFALSVLTRYEALEMCPAVFLVFLLRIRQKKLSFREAFLFIALWTVVFGVVFAGVILLTGTTQVLGGAFVKYRSQLLWLNCLFRS